MNVRQEDRDAAASYHHSVGGSFNIARGIRDGTHDGALMTQAFARHAQQAREAALREAAAVANAEYNFRLAKRGEAKRKSDQRDHESMAIECVHIEHAILALIGGSDE